METIYAGRVRAICKSAGYSEEEILHTLHVDLAHHGDSVVIEGEKITRCAHFFILEGAPKSTQRFTADYPGKHIRACEAAATRRFDQWGQE